MLKVLVTGASGFIGGAFLRRFALCANHQLYGVGRRAVEDLPPSVRYHRLPLARLDELDFTPDVVIHAAGRALPWGTHQQYQRDNVLTTQQVIDFCSRRGSPRLIFISSAAVYYRYCHQLGLDEESPIGPDFANDYALSKYQAEELVQEYQGEKTIVRACAVFGPGDRLLLAPLLAAARKGMLPYLLSPNRAARGEVVYIDVLCDYLFKMLTQPVLRAEYNISNNQPIEINHILNELLNALAIPLPKKQLRVETALRIAGFIENIYRLLCLPAMPPITRFGVAVFGYSKTLDVSRALADFGPPSMTLEQGITAFIREYKEQMT